jgi:hypothetical protein
MFQNAKRKALSVAALSLFSSVNEEVLRSKRKFVGAVSGEKQKGALERKLATRGIRYSLGRYLS